MKRRAAIIAKVLMVVILATLISGCVQVPITGQWDYGVRQVPLYGDRKFGQDFYVTDRNLTRVDIFFYPSKLLEGKKKVRERRQAMRSLKGKNIVMSMYSLPERRLLAQFKFPSRAVQESKMYAFVFDPVTDSKRQRFYFDVEAPGLTAEQAVSVRLTGIDRYKNGRAYINDVAQKNADLGFQTFIDMTGSQLLHSIYARLTADINFLIFWIALVFLVFVGVVDAWWRTLKKPPSEEITV